MKSFEDICREYYKSDEELENDLMSLLRYKDSGERPSRHISGDYSNDLLILLERMGLLEDFVIERKITDRGREVIKRGWITKDYATPKKKENWKIYREWLALGIALILGILGLFFP